MYPSVYRVYKLNLLCPTETYNGEGWTEVARYLQQFGMTSEQAEQCRELSEDRKREYVGEGNHELLYDSISNAVIAGWSILKNS